MVNDRRGIQLNCQFELTIQQNLTSCSFVSLRVAQYARGPMKNRWVSYFYWHAPLMLLFSSRRRHTRFDCDWSPAVCSSDLRTRRRRACESRPTRSRSACEARSGRQRGGSGGCLPSRPRTASRSPPLATCTCTNRPRSAGEGRKSVGEGKRVEVGGGRII